MAMVVNHNIPALTTYNTVNRTNNALEKSIQKLSTGLRINSAADDAAGLAISEKMRAQINGMDRAVSNAQDGISMIQTAEGALNETHSILQRMRELSVQAANDTLTSQDRGYIQAEIDALREEVTRIGNTTQFNKKKLLNGDAAVLWSSSDLDTKAIINGGLRSIDQFGQKVVTEGNYNIKIRATAGQAEVQKSDIFKVKHPNVVMNKTVNPAEGVKDVAVNNVPAGSYTVKGAEEPTEPVTVTGQYKISGNLAQVTATAPGGSAASAVLTGTGAVIIKYGSTEIAKVEVEAIPAVANAYRIKGTTVTAAQAKSAVLQEVANQISANATAQAAGITASYDATNGLMISGKRTDGVDMLQLDASTGSTGVTITPDNTKATSSQVAMTDVIEANVTDSALKGNASVLFEVTNFDEATGVVELSARASIVGTDGTSKTDSLDNIVLALKPKSGGGFDDSEAVKLDFKELGAGAIELTLKADNYKLLEKGSKFVYGITKTANAYVAVSGEQDKDWEGNWRTGTNTGVTRNPVTYGLSSSADLANKDISLKNYYLNEKTGEATLGEVILSTNDKFDVTKVAKDDLLAKFDAAYIGEVAASDVALRDLDKFWTSEGVFMLNDPQTITINQGDGKQASVTLYATDTLGAVQEKLNNAIADGLGQGQYVDDGSHFVTYVDSAGAKSESVPGTFLIRSVVPGSAGSLSFSGSEDLINAFSLNTIQTGKESTYTASVEDAHTGVVLANNVKVTGNKLVGVVHENVDVVFDPMAGINATWDDGNKKYAYGASTEHTTTLHLSDNTTVFQVGANEGEDMGIHIGDMRAMALGLDSVNVTNRESAARSITIIDNAIDKVSTQRAKIGAYQNRLEHTINNLNTASENITAAESRIRDTDMAKEMMNFTKLQIMLQAGTSMLAQANQLPQNVLSLVR